MSVKPRSFLKVFFVKGGILFYLVAIVFYYYLQFLVYNLFLFWIVLTAGEVQKADLY